MSAKCRYCCKSLFAVVTKNSPGCRRDFRVKMWGTSSPDDKLTGDLGNVIEATQIAGRRLVRLVAGNLSPANFGLLQHNLPGPDSCTAANRVIRSPRRQCEQRRRHGEAERNEPGVIHPSLYQETGRSPMSQLRRPAIGRNGPVMSSRSACSNPAPLPPFSKRVGGAHSRVTVGAEEPR